MINDEATEETLGACGVKETWLNVISVRPLVRGVPVVQPAAGKLPERRGITCIGRLGELRVQWDGCGSSTPLPDEARIDLDDHQGFGYALTRATDGVTPANLGIFDRWATGSTTDADRLAVARVHAGTVG